MRLGSKSRKKIEEFFRGYLGDPEFLLPDVRIYSGRGARLIVGLTGADGITFGRRVYLVKRVVSRNLRNMTMVDEELAVHEIVHTIQYRRDGFFGFLRRYVAEYLRNLRQGNGFGPRARALAYYNISYEVEAREIAASFVNWSRDRKKISN